MNKPIKVLQVMGSLNRGGAESMIMNLYRAIDQKQIKFDFVTHGGKDGAFTKEIIEHGGTIYCCPRYRGSNHIEYIKWWKDFFDEHNEYSILHSHVRSTASFYIPLAKKHGIKTIVHSHSTSNGSGIKALAKKLLQYPLRGKADYFLGCSKEASIWLFGEKIVNSSRYHMLQNAIDTSEYKNLPDERKKEYKEKFGLLESDRVLIHVGRFHESKNHLFLIDIFTSYLRDHQNTKLVLVGDGPLRKMVEDKCLNNGIIKNVIFTGVRDDVPRILQLADVFVFPSNWEGLPVSVVEAQAAGLPTLISDHVTRDVEITDLCKYLPIDKGVTTWVKAIEETVLISKADETEKIKEAGFDIHQSANWLINFYRRILDE
jgi:glycosyltransferase involved in cell wall biosynthesis